MLRIPSDLVLDIVDHALHSVEEEVVGVIVRHVNTHAPRLVRLKNSHAEPGQQFEVSEKDVARLYRELSKTLEYVDVLYHSHVAAEAIPSTPDAENAELEDVHYVIYSPLARGRNLRSWRMDGAGGMYEEQVEVLTTP